MKTLPKLAFLASHTGTNLQALLDACRQGALAAEPVLVISNNHNSGALQKAEAAGIPAIHLSRKTCNGNLQQLDQEMRLCLQQHGAQWIVLAGYLRPVGKLVLEAWGNRIINIHPGKLPEFGGKGMYGMKVHEAVLASGATETTITIHYVDRQYDHGAVIAEKKIPMLPSDTIQSLSAKVQAIEHEFYPATIAALLQKDL